MSALGNAGRRLLEVVGLRTTRHSGCEGWSHEETYRGLSPMAFYHSSRLRSILRTLGELPLPDSGSFADFGCSNGFILSLIRSRLLPSESWALHGLDHSDQLLDAARAKKIPGSEFERVDLNLEIADLRNRFDVATCFETLEHVGDFRQGLRNIYRSCKVGGHIVVSVPNEVGLQGLLKFRARKILQTNPYPRFFETRSEAEYVKALKSGADLEAFRQPPARSWGEHLGFDIRRLEEFNQREYLDTGILQAVATRRGLFDAGRMYVLRKVQPTE